MSGIKVKNDGTDNNNGGMTAPQKIKWLIYNCTVRGSDDMPELDYPCLDIDVRFEEKKLKDDYFKVYLHDGRTEAAYKGVKTDIEPPCSGYFEAESRAYQFPDGSWVGWTRYYGGGKHARPSEIAWEDEVYCLSCKEEQVTITKRTFAKE